MSVLDCFHWIDESFIKVKKSTVIGCFTKADHYLGRHVDSYSFANYFTDYFANYFSNLI
jgi:hypothetical protein